MKKTFRIILSILLVVSLSACATDALKAPCDHQGSFCGHKTKINQW